MDNTDTFAGQLVYSRVPENTLQGAIPVPSTSKEAIG
jgi:hypothetical protein